MLWNHLTGGSGSIPLPSSAHLGGGVPDYLKPVGQRGELVHHGDNHFHINNKSPRETADEVMKRLTNSLGKSMLSNQGEGDGTMFSPYDSGGSL